MARIRLPMRGLLSILCFILCTLGIAGCQGELMPVSTPPPISPTTVSSPIGTELQLGASAPAIEQNTILVLFGTVDLSGPATLRLMGPDGKDIRILAEVSPDRGALALSSDRAHVAFFTAPFDSDGELLIWDIEQGTMSEMPAPAEVSDSFRDALASRYLAWSPDDQSLAIVMNRDLYWLDITQPTAQVIVRHREERYNLAGLVMGSIGHPTWTAEGWRIIYDTFVPPEVLSAGADEYRDVEYVDVSTLVTSSLLEDAHIVPGRPAGGGQDLILQHDDGRILSLNLGTLEMQETTPLPATQSPPLCLAQNGNCVSIVSDQEGYSALAFAQNRGETHGVSLEDLGESATECQFQSTLWSPDGDSLLTTVGCGARVGLWSIRLSDLEATHLTDWAGVGSAVLLTWFQ